MAAAAVAVEAERDPVAVRAAQILVSLRFRKLRERPEWLPEASSSTAPAPALEVPAGWARRRPRGRGKRQGSAAPWRKAMREMDLAAGSAGEERDYAAPAPATATARRPAEAAPAGSGSPSTSSAGRRAAGKAAAAAARAAKEPMKASSPDTPLDYGAGGSGASSSADDAARPQQAKRRPPGARGSGGGGASCADDDEGCSSPAKRARVLEADDEEPIPTGPSTQSETRASITKGLAFDLDLNLPPPEDVDAC